MNISKTTSYIRNNYASLNIRNNAKHFHNKQNELIGEITTFRNGQTKYTFIKAFSEGFKQLYSKTVEQFFGEQKFILGDKAQKDRIIPTTLITDITEKDFSTRTYTRTLKERKLITPIEKMSSCESEGIDFYQAKGELKYSEPNVLLVENGKF